jgi:transglutaminase-like putative cysteine protease
VRARLLAALGPVLAALAVVLATRQPIHGACLLAAAGLGAAVGPSFALGANAQRLALALAGALGGVLGALLVPAAPPGQGLGGAACIVASALALAARVRLTFTRPEGGARADFALLVLTLLSVGQVRAPGWVLLVAGAALAGGFAAMRAGDPGRPRWRLLGGRARASGAAIAVGAVAFTLAMGWALPRLHNWAMVRFLRAYAETSESGLDDSLQLGALTSMLQSDELVLRVYGRGVDRVRGTAYDRYLGGRWASTRGPAHTILRVGVGPLRQADAVMIERVGAVRGWVMVPLATAALATEEGTVRVDPLGVVRAIPGDPAPRVWFRPGARTALAPSPPGPEDLALPAALRPRLAALAERFAAGAATPFERIERIAEALRTRYRYALRFERTRRVDPVLDFLERHPQGHCEYFASALALLGRAAGVPTRVIGGYRVAERNPLGDYYVVREKNAHAWVEAWDPARGWVTLDATPIAELPQNVGHESRWWAALADGVAVKSAQAKDWFEARTTEQRLGAALALLLGWLAWRTWRGRGEAVAGRAVVAQEGPLPCWEALASALSARGVARAPDETLERYAARVSATDLLAPAVRAETAATIRAYAALRYGEAGDAGEMVRRTNEMVRALQ